MIILQGFRPGIQAAVIQKGELDMDEMIHVAKLAESVEVASNDAMTQKLCDMMKASVDAAQNRQQNCKHFRRKSQRCLQRRTKTEIANDRNEVEIRKLAIIDHRDKGH
jgi:uncharacterized protein YdaT